MNSISAVVRIEPVLHHGSGMARLAGPDGAPVSLPFTLPGELVEAAPVAGSAECQLLRVLEPSPERVEPGCPHFGACGGCQLQMASAPEQLRLKQAVLLAWLVRSGIRDLPALQTHAAEASDCWGYRNRIRLRVGRDDAGALRLGYNRRASRSFLPVQTCPISAPLLWQAAEALLTTSARHPELRAWLETAAEVELFADDTLTRLQLLLLVEATPSGTPEVTFARAMEALRSHIPELAGAGAARLGPQQRNRERTRTPIASWGSAGLSYSVPISGGEAERYWITRGGFFQINRFLLPELVRLVCEGRGGTSAWDLFAGVGLFARPLARTFASVMAVEGNSVAARDLQAAFAKRSQPGRSHRAIQSSTLDFLRAAVLQRERPDLLTLDPPRAGAGEPACELLLQLRAAEMVYVSCDPETLARDLAVLQRGYRIAALHLVDMFPQTAHQETVVVLQRRA